jgi:uncharacterized protein YodC (DUF2158 family)
MSVEVKPGDVVRLRSGGPPMVVAEVYSHLSDYVRVVWAPSTSFEVQDKVFPVVCLVKSGSETK